MILGRHSASKTHLVILTGQRTFVIQARKGSAVLSVLVEKEQVQLLASEANQFLDKIAEEDPEEPGGSAGAVEGAVTEDEPLFRARLIGIGYDPDRHLVLIELREDASDEERTQCSVEPQVDVRAAARVFELFDAESDFAECDFRGEKQLTRLGGDKLSNGRRRSRFAKLGNDVGIEKPAPHRLMSRTWDLTVSRSILRKATSLRFGLGAFTITGSAVLAVVVR